MINEVCCICLEEGSTKNKLYHLPCNCNYYIHKICTKKISNNNCIICKNQYIEVKNINFINKNNMKIIYLKKNNFKNKYIYKNIIVYFLLFFLIITIFLIIFFFGFLFTKIFFRNYLINFFSLINFICGSFISYLIYKVLIKINF